MGCLSWVLGRKMTTKYRERIVSGIALLTLKTRTPSASDWHSQTSFAFIILTVNYILTDFLSTLRMKCFMIWYQYRHEIEKLSKFSTRYTTDSRIDSRNAPALLTPFFRGSQLLTTRKKTGNSEFDASLFVSLMKLLNMQRIVNDFKHLKVHMISL